MIQDFVGDLSFVWGSMSFLLVKFWPGTYGFDLYKCFFPKNPHQFIIFWRKKNSETPKFNEVAKIIEGF